MANEQRLALCNEALSLMSGCLKVYKEQTEILLKANKEALEELARRRGICYVCFRYLAQERYGGICENCFDIEYGSWLDDMFKKEVV